jgi:hypothetical protein
MVRRSLLFFAAPILIALCSGCLSLSLGGKHEIVTATDAETQNRLGSLEARVQSLEQRLGTVSGPALQDSSP